MEFPGQRYCQGLAARGFDPDENEPQFAGFALQLVEKNGLADSVEPGQDSRSFPLPGLPCLVEPRVRNSLRSSPRPARTGGTRPAPGLKGFDTKSTTNTTWPSVNESFT